MVLKHPKIPIKDLDDLWFLVGGTRCNLSCAHCFISCGPTNDSFDFMSLDQIKSYLEESVEFGVKEYYYSGGEPLMHPQIQDILELALQYGPVTLMTNGTLLKPALVERLAEIEAGSIYSLEIRISLDGFTVEMNDKIRGKGVFKKAMQGVRLLVQYGFLPIITVTKTWEDPEDEKVLDSYNKLLKSHGYLRPRVKILPSLKIGREIMRDRGYGEYEMVTTGTFEGYDRSLLLCSNTRIATGRGVYVCPILIEEDGFLMGDSLEEAMKEIELRFHACYTCYSHGAICCNISFNGG